MPERMAGDALQGARDVELEQAIDRLMRQGMSFGALMMAMRKAGVEE